MSDQDADKESWVRRRAYQLWQESGEGHGQHDDHWQQAERDYTATEAAPGTAAAAPSDLEQDLIETPPKSTKAGEAPQEAAASSTAPAKGAAAVPAAPTKSGAAAPGKL